MSLHHESLWLILLTQIRSMGWGFNMWLVMCLLRINMPSTWLVRYTGNFAISWLIADCSASALATEELSRWVPTTTPTSLIQAPWKRYHTHMGLKVAALHSTNWLQLWIGMTGHQQPVYSLAMSLLSATALANVWWLVVHTYWLD